MSRIQVIKGIKYPVHPWFKKENIEGTMEYMPKDNDIIISSYPKTGTIWLQYIVLQIISSGESFPSFNDVLDKVAPFMEIAGPEVIEKLTGVRIYKRHYRYDMVKKNPKSKVIYIYRNPEDILISFYHFMEKLGEEKLNFEEFFEGFIAGDIEFGNYFEHILSYLNHKDDDNLLLVSYEKLHAYPKEGILRIAKYLGDEYYQKLSTNESLLNTILKNTSFNHMKKNLKLELPHNPEKSSEKSTNTLNFFRKGIIGDGKNVLSTKHVKRIQEKAIEVIKDTDVLKDWIKE